MIESTLDTLSREQAERPCGRLLEALPVLEKAAQTLYGEKLQTLAARCELEAAPNAAEAVKYEAYRFETPYQHNAKLVLPYRAATVLLKALCGETNPTLYAVRQSDGSYSLELFEVRSHLVEILQEKTVVVLDSTVPPQLKMLLSELEEIRYEVPQNIEITQITNALYSKSDLAKPATRQLVAQGIKAFAQGSQRHLTILPQKYEDGEQALELPQASQVEHWGLHRATNQFSDCDSLALVGHHLRPIDRIEAEVKAIKGWMASKDRLAEVKTPEETIEDSSRSKLRLYNCRQPNGRAAGRWMHAHTDPDVQAAIEHDYTAHLIQAIGRLRAALRPAYLPPVKILILCNEPVGDLSIYHLTTIKRLGLNRTTLTSPLI